VWPTSNAMYEGGKIDFNIVQPYNFSENWKEGHATQNMHLHIFIQKYQLLN
jgi:hypothetical protein